MLLSSHTLEKTPAHCVSSSTFIFAMQANTLESERYLCSLAIRAVTAT